MADLQPYFQLLRVSADVTPAELKAAFRRQARTCHPDLHPENPSAEAEFQRLNEAYDIISEALYPSSQTDEFIHADGSENLTKAQALYARGTQKAAERDMLGPFRITPVPLNRIQNSWRPISNGVRFDLCREMTKGCWRNVLRFWV